MRERRILMTNYSGKRISILGDSISTFQDYTPDSAVFFDSFVQSLAGITSVDDTWWMQVINGLGGTLGTNNSYAGSTVYGTRLTAGCSDHRTGALGKNGVPDVILVSMGGNDCAFQISRRQFKKAYRTMLAKLKEYYPAAEIWCGTLLWGRHVDDRIPAFFNAEAVPPIRTYNELIIAEVQAAGCHLADLGEGFYDAMDGVHPNRNGMDFIAQRWLRAIQGGEG